MSKPRYTVEFKAEAVKQVTDRGYSVADVAERLGVSTHSLYAWLRAAGTSRKQRKADDIESLRRENARLKSELARAEEERAILKKAAAYFAKESG
jgi:transposase